MGDKLSSGRASERAGDGRLRRVAQWRRGGELAHWPDVATHCTHARTTLARRDRDGDDDYDDDDDGVHDGRTGATLS